LITISAFKWVPPMAHGLARDIRVRWALEEAGLPYRTTLLSFGDTPPAGYGALQPFGQVPIFEEDGLVLFETGAIVLHVAQRSSALLPANPVARARATSWLFAALDTVELRVDQLCELDLFYRGQEWASVRRPQVEQALAKRLAQLAAWIGDKDYLEQEFSVGDLMMASVLRALRHTELVARDRVLSAYLARCDSRPAFQRALAAQVAEFNAHRPD